MRGNEGGRKRGGGMWRERERERGRGSETERDRSIERGEIPDPVVLRSFDQPNDHPLVPALRDLRRRRSRPAAPTRRLRGDIAATATTTTTITAASSGGRGGGRRGLLGIYCRGRQLRDFAAGLPPAARIPAVVRRGWRTVAAVPSLLSLVVVVAAVIVVAAFAVVRLAGGAFPVPAAASACSEARRVSSAPAALGNVWEHPHENGIRQIEGHGSAATT